MLQRNVPAPAGLVRDRARVRYRRADRFCLHCDRTIAGQPVVPVFVTGVQGLFDQQAAEAGAVDEQVAFHDLPILQHQRFDGPALRVLPDLMNLAFDAFQSVALGDTAQEARIQAGIEMVGVVDLWLRLQRKLIAARSDGFQTEIAQFRLHAATQAVEPEMMERTDQGALSGDAERMDVAFARPVPVLEGNGELEGAGDRAQELLLVDLQEAVERADRRYRGFADADGADLLRLDQGNVQPVAELMRQRAGGKPTSGAVARDHYLAYPAGLQCVPLDACRRYRLNG